MTRTLLWLITSGLLIGLAFAMLVMIRDLAPILATSKFELRGQATHVGDLNVDALRVDIQGDVQGDLRANGLVVRIGGEVDGDVHVRGGWVEIRGPISGSLRVVGGVVSIYSTISGDVTVHGGQVRLVEGSRIEGSLRVNGGSVTLVRGSFVGGDVRAWAGNASFESEIDGSVEITTGNVEIVEGSSIGGPVTIRSSNQAVIFPGSVITNEISTRPITDPIDVAGIQIGHRWDAYRLLTELIAGSAILLVLPKRSMIAAGLVRSRPFTSAFRGASFLILVPVLVLNLVILVATTPLALVASAIYVGLGLGSVGIVGLAVGMLLLPIHRDRHLSRLGTMAIGIAILAGIRLAPVPYLDLVISLAILSAGFGALIDALLKSNVPGTREVQSERVSTAGLTLGIVAICSGITAIVTASVALLATVAVATGSAAFSWQLEPREFGLIALGLAAISISATVAMWLIGHDDSHPVDLSP